MSNGGLKAEHHSNTHESVLMVDGMHCSSCAIAVEAALKKQPNVSNANVNFAADVAVIYWRDKQPNMAHLQAAIARLGYKLHSNSNHQQRQQQADNTRKSLQLRLAVAVVFGMWSMMPAVLIYLAPLGLVAPSALWPLAIASGVFATPVVLYSGTHFYRVGWRTFLARAPGLDSLISLATVSACAISVYNLWQKSAHVYFDTAVMLITFQLIARLLETGVRRRATEVIHRLLQDLPTHITTIAANGQRLTQLLTEVKTGQRIVLEAGQTLALDGTVDHGLGLADLSMLSGEHEPALISAGSTLLAGCKLLEGELTLSVTEPVGHRRIDALTRSISALLGLKSSLQRLTDRIAGILLPIVISAALCAIGLAYWQGLNGTDMAARALAVLIVTCPCALSLAIPLVITMGHARMIENGIILREPSALEAAADVDVIVFDKTGTLSTHQPGVKLLQPQPRVSQERLIQLALHILADSPHPVATGLNNAYQASHTIDPQGERKSFIGQGTQWTYGNNKALAGNASWLKQQGVAVSNKRDLGMNVHLALNGQYMGHIVFSETPQPEAQGVIQQLQQQGFLLYMLSGDTQQACSEMAQQLGFNPSHVLFNQSPEDKLGFIQQLQKSHKVAFVGDGLNDTLALASATLGIAVGEANTATSSAGAIYLSGSIGKLGLTLNMAKRARLLMRQNLVWAIGYNAIVLPIAVIGWVQPVIAAIAMSLSSLCVLFNSLRMRAGDKQPE